MVPDDQLELQPGRGEIGRRRAQKPLESRGVPAKGAIVDALVRAMHQRFELPVDPLEPVEGFPPALDPRSVVTLNLFQGPTGHPPGRRRTGS